MKNFNKCFHGKCDRKLLYIEHCVFFITLLLIALCLLWFWPVNTDLCNWNVFKGEDSALKLNKGWHQVYRNLCDIFCLFYSIFYLIKFNLIQHFSLALTNKAGANICYDKLWQWNHSNLNICLQHVGLAAVLPSPTNCGLVSVQKLKLCWCTYQIIFRQTGATRSFCSVVVCMQNVCQMPRFEISPVTA